MFRRILLATTLTLALGLLIGITAQATPLTEEQRATLHEEVQAMKDAGATRDEVREYVGQQLEEWGIALNEAAQPRKRLTHRQRVPHRGSQSMFLGQLTDEQRTEVHNLIEQMKADEVAPEEIRAAVGERLESMGITLPECPQGLASQLAEDQLAEIQQIRDELKEADATREEIHEAVTAKLDEWGIEVVRPQRMPRRGLGKNLSPEQRNLLHDTVQEMRDAGATREEIRDAIAELAIIDEEIANAAPSIASTPLRQRTTWAGIKATQ